jgi:hypothetical protein
LCAWALVEEEDGSRRMVGMIADADSPDPYPATTFLPSYMPIRLFMYVPPGEEWDDEKKKWAVQHMQLRKPLPPDEET